MLPGYELIVDTKQDSPEFHSIRKVWRNSKFFEQKRTGQLTTSTFIACDMGEPDKNDDRLRTNWFQERIERIEKEGFNVLGIYKMQSIGKTNKFKDSTQFAIEVWHEEGKSPVDNVRGCTKY